MGAAGAWILPLRGGYRAAIGEQELVHVIAGAPRCFEIPGAPEHCRALFLWEKEAVPLLDPSVLLAAGPVDVGSGATCVLAYEDPRDGEVRLGGLLLAGVPRRVTVRDEQWSDLPGHLEPWNDFVLSCFAQEERPVAVLDLPALFSSSPAGDAGGARGAAAAGRRPAPD